MRLSSLQCTQCLDESRELTSIYHFLCFICVNTCYLVSYTTIQAELPILDQSSDSHFENDQRSDNIFGWSVVFTRISIGTIFDIRVLHTDPHHGKESMATSVHSTTRLQAYQTHLYSRSIQAELFQCTDSRSIIQNYYTVNLSITQGSHACTFNSVDGSITELVTDNTIGNPEIGLVESLICSAEKDYEYRVPRTKINYITTTQTEQLSAHLYNETHDELDQHSRDSDALVHRWKDQAGPCLSMIVAQEYANQLHIQAYHLIASESLVLRTQSIFELKD